ncbi:hypothetical protein LEP1GSC123_2821 [Leptospira borgpetersenii str. 200701203]|uniref:Uncharacterized protein n=1 Tax=Leptospira borgpetersenii str. 200701203 TaxID=1193007 RepID=M3GYJ1_LEPBO|nr:hypothetical protein LEP1GSC123_2821 [Leptospira borgpetersenii str. 200701203]
MEVAGATSVLSVDGSKQALDSFQRVLSLKKIQVVVNIVSSRKIFFKNWKTF